MAGETPVQIVNQPNGAVGSMGLKGWIATAGNATAMALIAAVFLWLLREQVLQARVDRLDDRQLFRESVHDIQQRADQRAGEIKGALDANSAILRELIQELRSARKSGMIRSDAELPKAPPPEK
jgi:hypothetical protein